GAGGFFRLGPWWETLFGLCGLNPGLRSRRRECGGTGSWSPCWCQLPSAKASCARTWRGGPSPSCLPWPWCSRCCGGAPTHPLAVVAVVFGALIVLDIAALIGGEGTSGGLYTPGYVLFLPSSLFPWGFRRAAALGVALHLSAYAL